jgi:predicted Ser/Thr protein kinase
MPVPAKAAYYRALKVKKRYQGRHSKNVSLLEKGVVRKSYLPEHTNVFNTEVDALRKLQKCKFVPRLYFVDYEKRTIYMSYCGKAITHLDKYKKQIKKYERIMEKEYQLFHNDIRDGNVCLHRGQLYIIDFGWARSYPGEAGHGEGKLGDPKSNLQPLSRKHLIKLLLNIHEQNALSDDHLKKRLQEALIQEGKLKVIEVDDTPGNSNPVTAPPISQIKFSFRKSDDEAVSSELILNDESTINDVDGSPSDDETSY